VFIREGNQMNNERKSSKAGERAAEGLREATAKDEAKNESKTGHDLAKGADRFEERSKSSDGRSAQEKTERVNELYSRSGAAFPCNSRLQALCLRP
jgi:hypothetical protein